MLTMLIDHMGYLFFPDQQSWRIIGRIALPIYAFALVLGYHRTRNLPRYIKRTAIIAAASQIPYMAAFNVMEVNVVGTLLVCLILLWVTDRWSGRPLLQSIAVLSALTVLELVPCDYGSYAAILVLIYRYAPAKWMLLAHLALNLVFFLLKGWYIQLFSLLPTFMLVSMPMFMKTLNQVRVSKFVWRSFYPLHLIILAIIHYLLNEM